MKKNVLYIKDLGLLEPLDVEQIGLTKQNVKTGPFNCYIDFNGATTITSVIILCCAEYESNNGTYTPTLFPQRSSSGLINYGSFDLSSSHDDFISTPIVTLTNKKHVLEYGVSNTLYFTIPFTIDKTKHLSTNSTKKILRLRYIPLDATSSSNGFFVAGKENDLSYQDILYRKDIIQQGNNISFNPISGLPYIELSFYLYEKSENNLIFFKGTTGNPVFDREDKHTPIIFIRPSFTAGSKILAFYNDTVKQTENYTLKQLDPTTLEKLTGTTNTFALSTQTISDGYNTVTGKIISFTNYKSDTSTKKIDSIIEITTNIQNESGIIVTDQVYLFCFPHNSFNIQPAGRVLDTIYIGDTLDKYLGTKILFKDSDKYFNINEASQNEDIYVKGLTYFNVVPKLVRGDGYSLWTNKGVPLPLPTLNFAISLSGAPTQNFYRFALVLKPDSTDQRILNVIKILYNIECKLIDYDSDKVIITKKGFGDLKFLADGSLDLVNSTGHDFRNITPGLKYQVIYTLSLKNYSVELE